MNTKKTFFSMAKKIQGKIKPLENMEENDVLSFLPKFLEEIFIAKSMIDVIIKEEDYYEDFSKKFVDLIHGTWSPNGWPIEEKLVWNTIEKNQIIEWAKRNFDVEIPNLDKKIIKLVYMHMRNTYTVLSAIIKEAEMETE